MDKMSQENPIEEINEQGEQHQPIAFEMQIDDFIKSMCERAKDDGIEDIKPHLDRFKDFVLNNIVSFYEYRTASLVSLISLIGQNDRRVMTLLDGILK